MEQWSGAEVSGAEMNEWKVKWVLSQGGISYYFKMVEES